MPPTEEDGDDYIFWQEFKTKYPNTDNINFRMIYKQISNDRADNGAHISRSEEHTSELQSH